MPLNAFQKRQHLALLDTIEEALRATNYNVKKAAEIAGVSTKSVNTHLNLMRRLSGMKPLSSRPYDGDRAAPSWRNGVEQLLQQSFGDVALVAWQTGMAEWKVQLVMDDVKARLAGKGKPAPVQEDARREEVQGVPQISLEQFAEMIMELEEDDT